MKGQNSTVIIFAADNCTSPKVRPFQFKKFEDVIADGYFQGDKGQAGNARRGKILRLADKPFGNGVLSVSGGKNAEP